MLATSQFELEKAKRDVIAVLAKSDIDSLGALRVLQELCAMLEAWCDKYYFGGDDQ